MVHILNKMLRSEYLCTPEINTIAKNFELHVKMSYEFCQSLKHAINGFIAAFTHCCSVRCLSNTVEYVHMNWSSCEISKTVPHHACKRALPILEADDVRTYVLGVCRRLPAAGRTPSTVRRCSVTSSVWSSFCSCRTACRGAPERRGTWLSSGWWRTPAARWSTAHRPPGSSDLDWRTWPRQSEVRKQSWCMTSVFMIWVECVTANTRQNTIQYQSQHKLCD